MVDADNARRTRNAATISTLFTCLNAAAYDDIPALFADDARWDAVFAPPVHPEPCDQPKPLDCLSRWRTLFSLGPSFAFSVEPLLDPDRFLVEFVGQAVVAATGTPYNNLHLAVVLLDDGRIKHVWEYFNPLAIIEAFGLLAPA